jgi:hypothetical protein
MADCEECLTNAGERMIVGNLWGYWAHLSIYRFAVPFAQGKRVLDAGSGSGYGSSYLARHGAKANRPRSPGWESVRGETAWP